GLRAGRGFERARDFGELEIERILAIFVALDLGRGARQIFLGRDVRELTLVRLLAGAVERGAHFRDPRAQGIVVGAELFVLFFEAFDLDREHVHLALLVEHGGGHLVARATADYATGVSHSAVECDRGDARVATRDGDRVARAVHQDGFADQRANQRFVRFGVAEFIGEAPFDLHVTLPESAAATGNVRRAHGDHVRAAALAFAQLGQQIDLRGRVSDDDARQARAEQTGERVRQMLGRLDTIGDHAEHARIALLREQRAGATAHAFQTAMQVFQRAQAIALRAELVLHRVDAALALQRAAAQTRELGFQLGAFVLGEALALGELSDAVFERLLAREAVRKFTGQLVALGRQAVVAHARLDQALRDAVQTRLGRGGASREFARLATQRVHFFTGLRFFRLQPAERFDLAHGVCFTRAFVARQLGHARGQRLALFTQAIAAHFIQFELGLHRVQALGEVHQAVTRALQISEQRADLVVGFERAARGFVGADFDRQRLFTGG